jgi:hypothetical protein
MTVAELKLYLADKKDDATVVVVAHNRDYEFTMSLGGGVDCEKWCDRSYDTVGFYVDELCHCERAQPQESVEQA